ncbi:MAG: hypothetical protein A3F16_05700 [Deltaproteobacteria bacterium RIFCSPHIGHO2_12_FULL_43_9]|nr:MAG: hypothetical protein A3F16_05700 [Deltaproteobacteria bacterium RIFCSPHIGHO2_12_FULL_43_9]
MKEKSKDLKGILTKFPVEEFTGYTEFGKLSAEQKLLWLSQARDFFKKYGGALKKQKKRKKAA